MLEKPLELKFINPGYRVHIPKPAGGITMLFFQNEAAIIEKWLREQWNVETITWQTPATEPQD